MPSLTDAFTDATEIRINWIGYADTCFADGDPALFEVRGSTGVKAAVCDEHRLLAVRRAMVAGIEVQGVTSI